MTVLALPESMATTKEDIMSESIVLHDTPLPRMPPRSVSLGISGLFLLVAFTLSTAAVRLTQTWQLVGVFLLGAILAFGGAALAKLDEWVAATHR